MQSTRIARLIVQSCRTHAGNKHSWLPASCKAARRPQQVRDTLKRLPQSSDTCVAAATPPPPPDPLLQAAEAQRDEQQWRPGSSSPLPPQLEGLAYLLLVALMWGSYTPALRVAYNLPGPPTPLALTAASGVLELMVLLAAMLLTARPQAQAAASGAGGALSDGSAAVPAAAKDEGLPLGLPPAAAAGLEIGLYNAAASWAQIAGLALTTATRGAFLIQGSTLFTPLLSALAGMAPGGAAWAGSLVALAGTLIIAGDSGGGGGEAAGAAAGAQAALLPLGDLLTLAAALCYSAATVRIPAWTARRAVTPLQLALGKAAFLAAASSAALGWQAAQLAAEGQSVASLWPGWQQPEGWALVFWAAVGPGALASVLQAKGQRLVSPTAAQITFCSVPIWSALLAAALLPGEAVSRGTLLGGAVVAAAGLVAALPLGAAPAPPDRPKQQ